MTEKIRSQWLKDNAVNVLSIDPEYEDFSDLEPLKKIIGDSVCIVMLGESTHGDGSTFLAKTRLIKFLHKEMGFNVLAFESGLYDCSKAWQLIKEGGDTRTLMTTSVFNLWSSTEQCQSLIKYVDDNKNSKSPLELSGFDCQLTGSISSDFLSADLDSLKLNCLSLHEENDFVEFMHSKLKYLSKDTSVYNNIFDKLLTSIKSHESQSVFSGGPLVKDLHFWEQVIENLKIDLILKFRDYSKIVPGDTITNMRDIRMGRILTWLSDYVYPGRKIIVWAANFHNTRNAGNISVVDTSKHLYRRTTTMGDVIWEKFGNKVYNLEFTAYEGNYRNIMNGESIEIPDSDIRSVEYLMYKAGFEYGLLNFRRELKDNGLWLKDRTIMKPLGYTEMEANWPYIMDGVFFIKEMKPSSY
jgi:erythromycin esterase